MSSASDDPNCSYCGYPLPERTTRCPECGESQRWIDRKLASRRAVGIRLGGAFAALACMHAVHLAAFTLQGVQGLVGWVAGATAGIGLLLITFHRLDDVSMSASKSVLPMTLGYSAGLMVQTAVLVLSASRPTVVDAGILCGLASVALLFWHGVRSVRGIFASPLDSYHRRALVVLVLVLTTVLSGLLLMASLVTAGLRSSV